MTVVRIHLSGDFWGALAFLATAGVIFFVAGLFRMTMIFAPFKKSGTIRRYAFLNLSPPVPSARGKTYFLGGTTASLKALAILILVTVLAGILIGSPV